MIELGTFLITPHGSFGRLNADKYSAAGLLAKHLHFERTIFIIIDGFPVNKFISLNTSHFPYDQRMESLPDLHLNTINIKQMQVNQLTV